MENNILEMLSTLLNKNRQSPNSQSINPASQTNQPPLYPVEAFSANPNQQTANTLSDNFYDNSNSNQGNNQNNMLPLLLSLMGQNGNTDMFSKLLQSQNGSSDISILANLFSALNKKKSSDKKEEDTSSSNESNEGEIPSNDIL